MSVFRIMAIVLLINLLPACVLIEAKLEEDDERRDRETILRERESAADRRRRYPSTSPEGLPGFVVTDIPSARVRFGGGEPTITNEFSIVQEIGSRASSADSLFFTDARSTVSGATVTPACSDRFCSFVLSGSYSSIKRLEFSLRRLKDLSLINDFSRTNPLRGYNSRTAAVMTDEGVTLIQSRAAARQDDYTRLAFQTYGGWLGDHSGSVFGLERITVSQGARGILRDAAFSFGNSSGTNPTGTGRAVWRGVFIGTHEGNDRISQGIAEIDIDDFASPNVDLVLSDVLDINSQSQVSVSAEWNDMDLTNGRFHHNNTAVMGSFYEQNHEEVGRVVNDRGWIGAFGGTRQ